MANNVAACLRASLFGLALGVGPVHAAVAGDASHPPALASDKTIADIQQAFDDQRYYLDAAEGVF